MAERKYLYVVQDDTGQRVMSTEYRQYRYPPEIEMQMLSLGYRITENGKRITKKETAEKLSRKRK